MLVEGARSKVSLRQLLRPALALAVLCSVVSTAAANIAQGGGAMSSFRYNDDDNGAHAVQHTLTQNARGLPLRSRDVGSATVLDHTFAYDKNGNPTSIDDALNLDDKSLDYDALDRLTSASGGFGSATMSYDGLDRLTKCVVNGRDWRYQYDGLQRLNSVTNAAGVQQVGLEHDPRGNVWSRTRGGDSVSFV